MKKKAEFIAVVLIAGLVFGSLAGCGRESNEANLEREPSPERVEVERPDEDVQVVEGKSAADLPIVEEQKESRPPIACDNPASDFTLPDINGRKLSLKDFRGKVVVLDFWTTYCRPCLMEIPFFIELHTEYRDRGFSMVGVSLDSRRSAVPRFVEKLGINYPVVYGDRNIVSAYGNISSVPTTFIIDRTGCIRHVIVGLHNKSQFESLIRPLLDEDKKEKPS